MSSKTKIRILNIEDDPLDTALILSMLEADDMDVDVLRVQTEKDFVAALDRSDVDVIISDFNLPSYDGRRALHVARSKLPSVPFIFFSGTLGEESAIECLREGASDYIIKQRPQRLPAAIRRALQEREERLKHQEAEAGRLKEIHFREAIELSMTSGVSATDLVGKQIYVNSAFARMVGWSAEELLGGTPPYDYWPPEEMEAISAAMHTTLKGEAPPGGYELTFCHRNGKRFHVLVTISPLQDAGNQVIGWLSVVMDITDRVRTQKELKETNEQLNQALGEVKRAQQEMIKQERMNALAQMVSGIVHDFNNSLMPLMGLPEYLLNQPGALDEREEVVSMLKAMFTAASDARDVVRRLREFYRPGENLEVKPFNLGELVNLVVHLTEPAWKTQPEAEGRSVTMELNCADLPPVMGNESSLREMLTNMVINASHAIPASGRIVLSTCREGDMAILRIADTGTGMSEEVKRRCFEPFFSTKGENGTGLGLAMCYGIIQRHGGSIDLESEPGRGTTFTIRLPIQGPTGSRLVESNQTARVKTTRSLRILAVDDSSTARSLIRRYLKAEGHEVQMVNNGVEGLAMLQKGNLDLVITDRAMPGVNGDELAVEAKKLIPGIPVIMLSGFGDLMNTKAEVPAGVDAVISKPVTPDELNAAIAQVLDK